MTSALFTFALTLFALSFRNSQSDIRNFRTSPMTITLQIEQMTLEEKLQTMEALWNDLCQHEEDVPVPQWHKDILDERRRLIEEGQAQFIDWETAKNQIAEETS